MSYVYSGNESDFYREFGGLPQRGIGLVNIYLIAVIIIVIIVLITALAFYFFSQTDTFQDRNQYLNLDLLVDLNTATTECCVSPGDSAPNENYIYDTNTNITYSRLIPQNINTVCDTFPNPAVCVADNTDSDGNIIPFATYKSQPYYQWESGLFIGCSTTTICPN